MEKTYNVSEASKILGVSVKTLQRWDRDGKLVANRTPSNRRFYTGNQLKEICVDKDILEDDGMNLKDAINNMKIGDVITIEFDDDCVDYITKTKWFDTTIFILGGLGRNGKPVIVEWFYEEEEIDVELVTKKIEELVDEDFKVKRYEGKITITYKADEVFRNFDNGNFQYRR